MSRIVLLRVDRRDGGAGHPRHLHPALDLKYVQAALMLAGYEAPLVDGWLHRGAPSSWIEAVMRHAPPIVAIKAASWCLAEATECAAAFKRHGVTTIAVGQQVEHRLRLPDARWRAAFDLALLGEPEEELPHCIVDWLAADADGRGRILDRYRQAFTEGRRFHVADPAVLPRPQVTAAELGAYPFPFPIAPVPLRRWGYVMSAWGCPHPCLHCTAVVRKSARRGLLKRPASDVADEVAALLEQGAQAISFEDDTLLADRRHFLALCEEVGRRHLAFHWMANARPDEIDDEVLQAMADTGGRCLKIGVETGAPRLIEMLGKADSGERWLEQTEAAFAALHRHKLSSVALFMVGMTGETREDVDSSLRLAQRLAPDYVQVQRFTAYPDIPLWRRPSLPDTDYYHYGGSQGTEGIWPQETARRQRRFYRGFYLRPRFAISHASRYWRHYVQPPAPEAVRNALRFMLPWGTR